MSVEGEAEIDASYQRGVHLLPSAILFAIYNVLHPRVSLLDLECLFKTGSAQQPQTNQISMLT